MKYDVFLYAYMRACGAPRDYYPDYLQQLGLVGPPRYHPHVPPLDEFSSYVRLLSLQYAEHDLDVGKCLRDAERCARAVEDAIDKGASPRARSGTTRALQHAQARYCAARNAEDWRNLTPKQLGRAKIIDHRPRPITIDAAEARYMRKRKATKLHLERVARRKAKLSRTEFTIVQEKYQRAEQAYKRARAAWHLTVQAYAQSLAEARLRHPTARAARDIVTAMNDAHAEYVAARTSRRQTRMAYYTTKAERIA